jgi:hypothetical protein
VSICRVDLPRESATPICNADLSPALQRDPQRDVPSHPQRDVPPHPQRDDVTCPADLVRRRHVS